MRFPLAALLPLTLIAMMGFQVVTDEPASKPSTQPSEDEMVFVVIETSKGDIYAALNKTKAPITVENFVGYTNDGFYDGTIFHRVMKDFMVQGGGLTPEMDKKPTKTPIKLESSNGLKNNRGTLAMARTSAPDSATSQFFINDKDNDFLNKSGANPGYAVFGQVVAGMEVVDVIAEVPTTVRVGRKDVPAEVVMIEEVRVIDEKDAQKAIDAEKAKDAKEG